jgi:hypothetical protein
MIKSIKNNISLKNKVNLNQLSKIVMQVMHVIGLNKFFFFIFDIIFYLIIQQ